MLLFLLGGGVGLKALLMQNFNGFASNASVVFSSRTSKPWKGFRANRFWEPDIRDVERLKMMMPELDVVTPIVSTWGAEACYEDKKADGISLKGISAEYSKIESPEIKYGRYLNDADILQERKVCVIGKTIYTSLFPDGGDPCGKYVQIGPVCYQIVGVDMRVSNMSINGSADLVCSIPFPVFQKVYNRGKVVDLICITAKGNISTKSIEPKIRETLARAHSFDPSDKTAVVCLNLGDFFSLVDNLMRGVDVLILLVGLGTILAGAIGVSNIMMVTVKERTTEIGIRRAIGAQPKDILSQIIIETVSITTIAGSLGIVFSVQLLKLLTKLVGKGLEFQITLSTALLALVFIVVLGVVAGLAPARRAMKIKAVDAMRDE